MFKTDLNICEVSGKPSSDRFWEQEINRKQFEWRNKFSVALPAVNWLRVAAPRRRRNLRMEAPSCALSTHAPAAPRQLGVFMSEKSAETHTGLSGS